MMCFTRRSFLQFLLVVTALFLSSSLASAQHPVIPPHPVAPVHVSPPQMYHPPVMQTPIVRPPIPYAPIYTPPRNGIVPSAGGLRTSIVLPPVRPIRPIRPFPPVIFIYSPRFYYGDSFWQSNSCWMTNCELFWPWITGTTNISSPVSSLNPANYVLRASDTPVYGYGGEREDFPQLFLKDGTILSVTDYWVVDGELHFTIVEAIGQKPVEHSIPFEELDLQKTVDANTARGFRFILRNEPYEQYLRDHPEGPPPALSPSHQESKF